MTAAGDYGGPEDDRDRGRIFARPQTTADEQLAATMQRLQNERDRAVGSVLVLVHDGVISFGRATELLGMTVMQLRDEFRRVANQPAPEGEG